MIRISQKNITILSQIIETMFDVSLEEAWKQFTADQLPRLLEVNTNQLAPIAYDTETVFMLDMSACNDKARAYLLASLRDAKELGFEFDADADFQRAQRLANTIELGA